MSLTAAAIIVATGLLEFGRSRGQIANANTPQESGTRSNNSPSETVLDLSPSRLNSIKIEPVGSYRFPAEKEAVGNIDFADDLSVQVFPAYQGTIIKSFVEHFTLLELRCRVWDCDLRHYATSNSHERDYDSPQVTSEGDSSQEASNCG